MFKTIILPCNLWTTVNLVKNERFVNTTDKMVIRITSNTYLYALLGLIKFNIILIESHLIVVSINPQSVSLDTHKCLTLYVLFFFTLPSPSILQKEFHTL